jgi:hypothetical protein
LLEGQLSYKGKVLQELTTRVNFEVINENIHANL